MVSRLSPMTALPGADKKADRLKEMQGRFQLHSVLWSGYLEKIMYEGNYSRREMADKMGVDPSYLTHWSNNKALPSRKLAHEIAERLGLPELVLYAGHLPDALDSFKLGQVVKLLFPRAVS